MWAPNTMLSFRKKIMSKSRENLRTDGKTDGRTDVETLFHRTFPAEAGGPTNHKIKTKRNIFSLV